MSQSKVSDYFNVKKGSSSYQPSKRIKLDHEVFSEALNSAPEVVPLPKTRTAKKLSGSKASVSSVVKAPTKRRTKVKEKNIQHVKDTPNESSKAVLKDRLVKEGTAACFDDHNATPPCSPAKRNQNNQVASYHEPSTRKRVRISKPKDLFQSLEDMSKTPDRGFDFSKSVDSQCLPSAKKRLIMSPKSICHTEVCNLFVCLQLYYVTVVE